MPRLFGMRLIVATTALTTLAGQGLAHDHWHHDHFGADIAGVAAVGAAADIGVAIAESGRPRYSETYTYGGDGWGPWADMGVLPGWNAGWNDQNYISAVQGWGYSDVSATCDNDSCDLTGVVDGGKEEFHIERNDGAYAARRWHG